MTFTRPTPGVIERFATEAAQQVAAQHAGDPLGELTVWLQMALRREASVGEVYEVANLERRLARVTGPREHLELVRRTFSNIWAQEKGHAAYLEAMLSSIVRRHGLVPKLTSRFEAVLGELEGQVLSARTSPGLTQRLKSAVMLAAGRFTQDIPDFVRSLGAMPFRDFCLLNAELEVTAIHGYERMMALLEQLEGRGVLQDTTFKIDIARFILDEQFHNQTFQAMDAWFEPSNATGRLEPLQPRLSLEACRGELAQIRFKVYGEPIPAHLAPTPAPKVKKPRAARPKKRAATTDDAPPAPVIRLVRKSARSSPS